MTSVCYYAKWRSRRSLFFYIKRLYKGLNFLKLSDDRDVWRGMVANVCSRSGT